jgi:Spy/CpxP family protein refolding chaperone
MKPGLRNEEWESRRKERGITTAFLLFLFLLCVPANLPAQDSYREFERGLGLTEPQRRQVDGIKQRYVDEWRMLKDESMRRRLELQELNRNPSANRERADRLRRELDSIQGSRQQLYQRYQGEVGHVLTPEQRGRFDRFCDSERQRMMQQQGDRQRMMQQQGDRQRMMQQQGDRPRGHGGR